MNDADLSLLAFGQHYLGCCYCSPSLATPLELEAQLCYRGRKLWADLTDSEREGSRGRFDSALTVRRDGDGGPAVEVKGGGRGLKMALGPHRRAPGGARPFAGAAAAAP
jgi:hypothetical protein